MSKLHLNAEERTFLNFTKISLKTLSNCRLSQNLLKNCRSPSADNWYHIVGKDVKPLSENNEIKNQIICFYVIKKTNLQCFATKKHTQSIFFWAAQKVKKTPYSIMLLQAPECV